MPSVDPYLNQEDINRKHTSLIYKKERKTQMNNWKKRSGVVYSTASDYAYETSSPEEETTLPPTAQRLRVHKESKGRGGKTVTVVSGFTGHTEDLQALGRVLKSQCGVGGSVKGGEILIQGDLRERIIALLRERGYTDTK